MLPAGLVAHAAPAAERQRLGAAIERALTVARLDVGACGCDLVRPRLADVREDERWLRERYRALGLPRDATIRSLDRHRRGALVRPPTAGWPRALAAFVAEHARNAGDTLFDLAFAPEPEAIVAAPLAEPVRLVAAEVVARPSGWLEEGRPVLVAR